MRTLIPCFVAAALALPAALAAPQAPAPQKSVAEQLVGTWRLERYADTPEGGKSVYAFGEKPFGLFIFTADGHISVHLMHNPPNPKSAVADPDPDACIPAWYCSYYGTYKLDAAGKHWITHVIGANIPTFIGTSQERAFTLQNDKIVIADSYKEADGKTVHTERILVRER